LRVLQVQQAGRLRPALQQQPSPGSSHRKRAAPLAATTRTPPALQVADPGGALLECRDYLAPIITPGPPPATST
jgi:hypothetical protein